MDIERLRQYLCIILDYSPLWRSYIVGAKNDSGDAQFAPVMRVDDDQMNNRASVLALGSDQEYLLHHLATA